MVLTVYGSNGVFEKSITEKTIDYLEEIEKDKYWRLFLPTSQFLLSISPLKEVTAFLKTYVCSSMSPPQGRLYVSKGIEKDSS